MNESLPSLLRIGEPGRAARRPLRAWRADPRVGLVADHLPHADIGIEQLRGHRQVTETSLVGLAEHHGMELVTIDPALHGSHPATTLVPGG